MLYGISILACQIIQPLHYAQRKRNLAETRYVVSPSLVTVVCPCFSPKLCMHFPLLPCMPHASPVLYSWLDCPNIWQGVQVTEHLIMSFSAALCCFLTLTSKYSLQHNTFYLTWEVKFHTHPERSAKLSILTDSVSEVMDCGKHLIGVICLSFLCKLSFYLLMLHFATFSEDLLCILVCHYVLQSVDKKHIVAFTSRGTSYLVTNDVLFLL